MGSLSIIEIGIGLKDCRIIGLKRRLTGFGILSAFLLIDARYKLSGW